MPTGRPEPWYDRLRYEVDPETGCWVWQGGLARGYAHIGIGRKIHAVHRLMFEREHGYSPPTLDHTCKRTSCIRVDHLEDVTQAENVRRTSRFYEHVAEIRQRVAAGERQKDVAREFGAHPNTVWRIVHGRSHVG